MVRKLLTAGMLIILAGFSLIIAGSVGQAGASTGGVIFIGPFPIVFGSGLGGAELALLSVVIGGVMLAVILLWIWRLFAMKGSA